MIRALAVLLSALVATGCGEAVTDADAGDDAMDAAIDAPVEVDAWAPPDAPPRPDGPILCSDHEPGACGTPGEICWCCPGGGASARNCLCSTGCSSDADCHDPDRPACTMATGSGTGFCIPRAYVCCWDCT
jgi:hypothetical protein